MVIKKICILLFLLFPFLQIYAQNIVIEEIAQPDSILIDTLKITTIQDSIKLKRFSLKVVEHKVRALEDTFFNIEGKIFNTNVFYWFGENFYYLPYQENDYSLLNLNMQNLFLTENELLNFLYYYNFDKKENSEYIFSVLETDFQATLTTLKYFNGAHNYENKFINIQKNNFLNLFDIKLFLHSGEDRSPWESKNYFDNFILQFEKTFSSYKINYNFLKLFSAYETYNFINPLKSDVYLWEHYLQKIQTNSHIIKTSLFDNFIDFSYLYQTGHQKIYNASVNNNRFYRNQFDFIIHLPVENYETDISFRADINDYKHPAYNGIVEDYYVTLKMDSPGIFYDFYTMQIINQIYFSGLCDTTLIYPQLLFNFPVNKNFTTIVSIGTRGKQYPLQMLTAELLENIKEIVFADFTLHYKSSQYNFSITPFAHKVKNDIQWTRSGGTDSVYCEKIKTYNTFGFTTSAEAKYDFLTTKNKFRLNFYFTKNPDNLVFRPNVAFKLLWEIKKDLHHNNFIYLKSEMSYVKDFRNSELKKEKDEIFLDLEFGININRFRISLLFKNILEQDYFMDKNNLINDYGTCLKIQWDFIN